ncbi:Protein of unknown function [Formivibrio citricus]|uniref:DUF2782 domain-containing protein n=1 Tax=Formivibrio citricus TaxID=83765 RepID=A0A1I5C4A6_9NEIS|nr:DUF2782 domain-containing protein [Formivibrio citricus]SFN81808.1 Protein of unknown function [Formivibrio citricus]
MRRFLLLALFPVMVLAAPAPVPAPAEPPLVPQPGATDEPEVRIVESKDGTVTEYRRHGKLYMMKVTPKGGVPYYLIDNEGKGRFDRADLPANGRIAVPHWVLFEF